MIVTRVYGDDMRGSINIDENKLPLARVSVSVVFFIRTIFYFIITMNSNAHLPFAIRS